MRVALQWLRLDKAGRRGVRLGKKQWAEPPGSAPYIRVYARNRPGIGAGMFDQPTLSKFGLGVLAVLYAALSTFALGLAITVAVTIAVVAAGTGYSNGIGS